MIENDQRWMREAIHLAERAAREHEVPVGAVLIHDNAIVGRGYNRREIDRSPLAHAEILAIAEASARMASWRLLDSTLYVTLEPCIMCIGAIIQARITRVVYGCADPKAGAVESLYKIATDERLNHRATVTSGVLADQCSQLLRQFFSDLRRRGKGETTS